MKGEKKLKIAQRSENSTPGYSKLFVWWKITIVWTDYFDEQDKHKVT